MNTHSFQLFALVSSQSSVLKNLPVSRKKGWMERDQGYKVINIERVSQLNYYNIGKCGETTELYEMESAM